MCTALELYRARPSINIEVSELADAQATLRVGRLNEILGKLENVCCKHTQPSTLQACSEAWAQLLKQEGAPALQEAVRTRYQRLCGKLMLAIKPVAAPLMALRPGGAVRCPDLFDLDVALRRLSAIARVQQQPLTGLRALTPHLLSFAETGAHREDVNGCITSLLELLVIQFIFSAESYKRSAARDSESAADPDKNRLRLDACKLCEQLLPLLARATNMGDRPLSLKSYEMLGAALIAGRDVVTDSDCELYNDAQRAYISKLNQLLNRKRARHPAFPKDEGGHDLETENDDENEVDDGEGQVISSNCQRNNAQLKTMSYAGICVKPISPNSAS